MKNQEREFTFANFGRLFWTFLNVTTFSIKSIFEADKHKFCSVLIQNTKLILYNILIHRMMLVFFPLVFAVLIEITNTKTANNEGLQYLMLCVRCFSILNLLCHQKNCWLLHRYISIAIISTVRSMDKWLAWMSLI